MSPSDWIALTGPAVALLAAAVGYGVLRQQVKDLERARDEDRDAHAQDCRELRERVSAAETAAGAVKGLALAIENMGEKFTLEVKHLVEKVGLETGHIREQLTDLKEEVRRRQRPSPQRKRVQG